MKRFSLIMLGALLSLLLIIPHQVFAQTQETVNFVKKVEIEFQGGPANNMTAVTNQFPGSTTIYRRSNKMVAAQESFLKNSSTDFGVTTDSYVPIQIKDPSVGLVTRVEFDASKLSSLGGWSDVSGIWIHKSCGGTVAGDQYIAQLGGSNAYLPIRVFQQNGYAVEFPSDPDCKLDLFHQNNSLTIEFWLKKNDGTQIQFAKADYNFRIEEKPELYTCELHVYNATTNTEINSADNETPIKIVGSNINMGESGYRDYLNGKSISGGLDYYNSTEKSFERIIGKLEADKTHTFSLREAIIVSDGEGVSVLEGDKDICRLNLPITRVGDEPIPIASVSGALLPNQQVTLEFAPTLPLCDSIPETADCNGISCKTKCLECENAQKVWTGLGCMPTNISGLVSSLFTAFSGLLGAFIFFCIFSNGLKIMASRGNAEALKKGQEAITSCIVGLVVLVLSVLFLRIVGVNILQLPGWS